MAKARRLMKESLEAVDMVIELCDARIPFSSRNPDFDDLFKNKARIIVLNKADLADETITKKWEQYYLESGIQVLSMCAVKNREKTLLMRRMEEAAKDKVERMAARGAKKTVRAMITGIPNVGKSTLINAFAGKDAARTANRPGVTRGKQLIRITPYLELMDTPGVLWPKLEDTEGALRLALTGAIKEQISDPYQLSRELITRLRERYPQMITARYRIAELGETSDHVIEQICKGRGFLLRGGEMDVERGARVLLDEFRNGILGRISLETPEDIHEREEIDFEL